jgi:hypothetical protein
VINVNVIIANKYQPLLATLEIDVIKSMAGEFEVDEIVKTFEHFYFNKMILDITAIKDYKNIANIQKLSVSLDMDKVILLLDESEESSSSLYLSKLISLGIYNFTKNKEGIMYLYNNPNTYKDVAHIHQLGELTETPIDKVNGKMRILGIKNVTEHAGATTLAYMLMKQLSKNYAAVAVEVDKHDFTYFNDKNLLSIDGDDLSIELMKLKDVNVIVLDLNDYEHEEICNDIIYLVEPSTVKLNKLIKRDRRIFEKLRGSKVVLNKSLLNSKDVSDFEYEAKIKVFANIPPLDERQSDKPILDVFLTKLGFIRQKIDEKSQKSSIFSLFKF